MGGPPIAYAVHTSEEFDHWWERLSEDLQDTVAAHVGLLEEIGPALGRPYVDTLRGSALPNLKELRVPHRGRPYRILFAFDPNRAALLLLGGDKGSDKRWYDRAIRKAEAIFARHLEHLEE